MDEHRDSPSELQTDTPKVFDRIDDLDEIDVIDSDRNYVCDASECSFDDETDEVVAASALVNLEENESTSSNGVGEDEPREAKGPPGHLSATEKTGMLSDNARDGGRHSNCRVKPEDNQIHADSSVVDENNDGKSDDCKNTRDRTENGGFVVLSFVFDSPGPLGLGVDRVPLVGCVVTVVTEGGQAHKLGVLTGDVILRTACGDAVDGIAFGDVVDGNVFQRFVELARSSKRPLVVTAKRVSYASAVLPLSVPQKRLKAKDRGLDDSEGDSLTGDGGFVDSAVLSPSSELRAARHARDRAAEAKRNSSAALSQAVQMLEQARATLERAQKDYDEAVDRDRENVIQLKRAEDHYAEEQLLQKRPPWDAMYDKLVKFKEMHGHTWVPVPNMRLDGKEYNRKKRKKRSRREADGGVEHTIVSEENDGEEEGGVSGADVDVVQTGVFASPENTVEPCEEPCNEEHNNSMEGTDCDMSEDNNPVSSHTRASMVEDRFRRWVCAQRKQYRLFLQQQAEQDSEENEKETREMRMLENTMMKPERARLLKDIGFVTSYGEFKKTSGWDEMYDKVLSYVRSQNRPLTELSLCSRGGEHGRLGRWVARVRNKYKEGSLSDEQVRAMEQIDGFQWEYNKQPRMKRSERDEHWDKMYERLLAFKGKHGHVCVPTTQGDDPELSAWVVKMRAQNNGSQNKGTITYDRREALENVGFVWNVRDAKWNGRLAKLAEFRAKFGHCDVARKPGPYQELGRWAHMLRCQYTQKQDGQHADLTEEQIKTLEDMGFRWQLRAKRPREATSKTEEQIWNENFEQLREFRNLHGHVKVNKHDLRESGRDQFRPSFRRWVSLQKRQYKDYQDGKPTNMTVKRIRLLEEVGFDWVRGAGRRKVEIDLPGRESSEKPAEP